MSEKLEFDLSVKNNQLSKTLDDASKKAFSLEGALETAVGVLGGGLAVKAFDSLISGFNSLISIGKESVDAAAAQEVATNNLNNALARQGNYSKETSEDILAYASAMQQSTVYEDDAVISSAALLQSLTKLSAEGLKEGVTAAADFATVLGIDLETATRLVAKAAEGNTEAFKKYGVEIKKGTTDAETFANTTEALNRQFGGASAAQLNTYSGSLKAMNNAYGDLLEPIGDIIVKNPIVIGLFNEIKRVINEANTEVTGLVPAMQSLVRDGFFASVVAVEMLLGAFDKVGIAIDILVGTFQGISGMIGQTLIAPFELLIDGIIEIGKLVPGLGDTFENLENPLNGATKAMSDLQQNGVNKLASSFDDGVFAKARDDVGAFAVGVADSAEAVRAASEKLAKNNEDAKLSNTEKNAEILAAEKQLAADILLLQSQSAAEQAALNTQLANTELEGTLAGDLAKIDAITTQKLAEAQAVYEGELKKNEAIKDADQRRLANDKAYETLRLASIKATGQRELDEKKRIKAQDLKDQETFLSTAVSLSDAKSKELAAIGKAAAIANIAIKTPDAVASSFAFGTRIGGPALGFTLGAIAATAMAAQAAKVAGVAFEQGGIVGQTGATAGADNRVATIRDGEMVLNGNDQKTLFDAIKSGSLGGGNIQLIIDGREIAVAVRNQIQGGFRLA